MLAILALAAAAVTMAGCQKKAESSTAANTAADASAAAPAASNEAPTVGAQNDPGMPANNTRP